ncbi:MAG: flavin reductase family protein [Chitinophagaceae bacterium]|nr:flavin reductase family protein [Anaerolineae bacterium]
MSLDPQIYKQTMGQWATGVTVVTTIADGTYYGMTANSFISVSINPLLVLISVDHKAQIHPLITQSQVFAVSILNAAHIEWGKRFAGFNKDVMDRFEGIPFETAVTGSPVLPGVIGWVDCRLYTTYEAGDHTLFVGEVLAAEGPGGADPLLYFNRVWGTFKALE